MRAVPGFSVILFCGAVVAWVLAGPAPGRAEELRPGVWAGRDLGALPVAVSGYQVYLVGEMHGAKENEDLLAQYIAGLAKGSGLRDVGLEEDAVYDRESQAYVADRQAALPEALCLPVSGGNADVWPPAGVACGYAAVIGWMSAAILPLDARATSRS